MVNNETYMYYENVKKEIVLKRVAVCVCGCIRSFSREPYRESLSVLLKEIPNADFFLMLKIRDIPGSKTLINSSEGIEEFLKTVDVIKNNLIKIVFFEGFTDNVVDSSRYYSQRRNMDLCFNLAQSYKTYDYYMRLRPDFIFLKIDLPVLLDENTVYTSIKDDSPGSDMCFLFSNKLKGEWWDKKVLNIVNPRKLLLDYVIFDDIVVDNGSYIYGGLLRTDDKNISIWDNCKDPEVNDFHTLSISNKSFVQKTYLDRIMYQIEQRYRYIDCYSHGFIQ